MSLLCGWKLIFFGGEKIWSPKRGGTKEMVLSVESKARKIFAVRVATDIKYI